MYWRQSNPPSKKSALEIVAPALPAFFWFAGAVLLLFIFRSPVERLLDRATEIKVAGVELKAAAQAITRSVEKIQAIPERVKRPLPQDDPLRDSLVRRWAEMRMADRPLRILLLHDRISTARALREPFTALGFSADIGICAVEAESLLRRHAYDVVISDIDWSRCAQSAELPSSGTEFLMYAQRAGIAQPTVFYVTNFQPERGTPPYASGISNNWYEVLHFVLDILSRRQ